MMQSRVLPLVAAVLLQVLPLCRVVTVQLFYEGAGPASIIMRWVVGAVALMGSVHAVSGASTVITSPTTAKGTNGVPFSYRITTGPEVANTFNAAPLPPGLVVSTTSGKITGTPTVSGIYSVLLTASDSNLASRTVTATLTLTIVDPPAAAPPVITTQPQSQTVTAGSNVTFSVAVTGTGPLSYQWRLEGTNLPGKTAASLLLSAVTVGQAGNYSVVVSNVAGVATSNPALLTVNPAPVPPSITSQPQSQSVLAGATVSFSVTAEGTAPLTYQWRRGTTALAGQTGSTLTLTSVTTNQAGQYSVIVSNRAGTATSQAATLTVTPVPVAPAIVTQPQSRTVTEGTSVTFSVAASGTTPMSYQWLFGTNVITNQTAAVLTLTNVSTNQAGEYSVLVSNQVGTATSLPALLTVSPAPVAPSFTSQPQSQTVTEGGTVTFQVTVSGTSPFSYQWRLGNNALPGQTGSSLTLTNVKTGQAGSYSVVVSNAAGSVTSQPAVLTVNPLPVAPTIATQPANRTVSPGATVTFSVTARGTGPLSYQWWFGGEALPGETGSSLQIANVQSNHVGQYSVVVSNVVGSVTSAPARLALTTPGGGTTDAWAAVAGKYSGLLHDPNGVALGSSGFFTFTLSGRGTYTASILLSGGWRLAASGVLAPGGMATNSINRPGATPVTVIWSLDSAGNGSISGSVLTTTWAAELSGDRAIFNATTNPCPYAGKYTLVLPGVPGATDSPAGDGYGAVTVDTKGMAMLKGMNADGSKLVQKVPISSAGDWPLFVSLYGRTGAVLSWLKLEDRPGDDLHGTVAWLKPLSPATALYPAGFAVQTELVGSRYVVPGPGVSAVQFALGTATATGGDLSQSYTVTIQSAGANQWVGATAGTVQFRVNPATGLFSGTLNVGGLSRPLNCKGAVLQKINRGSGCFLGTTHCGRVGLE